jgi:hypothetical protein
MRCAVTVEAQGLEKLQITEITPLFSNELENAVIQLQIFGSDCQMVPVIVSKALVKSDQLTEHGLLGSGKLENIILLLRKKKSRKVETIRLFCLRSGTMKIID